MTKKEQAKKIAEMMIKDSERYGLPIKIKEDKKKSK